MQAAGLLVLRSAPTQDVAAFRDLETVIRGGRMATTPR